MDPELKSRFLGLELEFECGVLNFLTPESKSESDEKNKDSTSLVLSGKNRCMKRYRNHLVVRHFE